jgi:hypothetical protein
VHESSKPMRVFEHDDTSVSFVHNKYVENDSEHFILSKNGFSHSVGQLVLLTEIPTEDVMAIVGGYPKVLAKYILPDIRQRNRYIPLGDNVELYDAPYGCPIMRHDYLIEVSSNPDAE